MRCVAFRIEFHEHENRIDDLMKVALLVIFPIWFCCSLIGLYPFFFCMIIDLEMEDLCTI